MCLMKKSKICTKCKIKKTLDEFSSHKRSKDRKEYWCKECCNTIMKQYYTKYPWKLTLVTIKRRCNNPKNINYKYYGGKRIKCLITADELKQLWFRDKAYLMKTPSIDRKNSNKNYTFENCRFIELSKNIAKMNKESKSKLINQYNLEGKFLKSFRSASEVQRKLGYDHGFISVCCLGKRKTAYGFKWEFAELV